MSSPIGVMVAKELVASFPFLSSLESISLYEMVKAMLLSMFYASVCVSNHKSAEGREEL